MAEKPKPTKPPYALPGTTSKAPSSYYADMPFNPMNPAFQQERANKKIADKKAIASPQIDPLAVPEKGPNALERMQQVVAKAKADAAASKTVGVKTAGTGTGTGNVAAAVNPIDAMYKPMFDLLKTQEKQQNARYEANLGDITNIYGQLTSARTADISSSATAFQQLRDAAAARTTALNTQIDTSEAARLNENRALLSSMGMADRAGVGSPAGDVASQQAAMSKDINTVSGNQWQSMLDFLGRTQAGQIEADKAGYGYRAAEATAALGSSLLEAQQARQAEQAKLTSQKSQAQFEYKQAQQRAAASAAAAAARATTKAAKDAAKAQADLIKNAGPVDKVIATASKLGYGTDDIQAATAAYYDWMSNRGTQRPEGQTTWRLGSAQSDAQKTSGAQLSLTAKGLLNQLLAGSYKP